MDTYGDVATRDARDGIENAPDGGRLTDDAVTGGRPDLRSFIALDETAEPMVFRARAEHGRDGITNRRQPVTTAGDVKQLPIIETDPVVRTGHDDLIELRRQDRTVPRDIPVTEPVARGIGP